MASQSRHDDTCRPEGGFLARIRHRLRRGKRNRIDPETLRHLEAPAKLFVWQADGVAGEGTTFDSLREAIRQVPDDPDDRAFIITENGKIMRPVQIARLKELLATSG